MMKMFSIIAGFMLFTSACGHDSDKSDPAPVVLTSPPAATLTNQFHIRYLGSYSNTKGSISSKLAQTHMKLDIAAIQNAAQNAQSCGFNSWPLDTWLDVTGHACPATPEKGGVWTEWTQPGQSLLRASYNVDAASLTFNFSDGKAIYRRVL